MTTHNTNDVATHANISTKKTKKKKKTKNTYKSLLRSIKKSSRTDEQKKADYRNKLSQSLGGGSFNKIDKL